MRSTLIVSAFAALAFAAPRPQDIDFTVVDAAPDAPIYEGTELPVAENVAPQSAASLANVVKGSVTEAVSPDPVEKRDILSVIDRISKRVENDCSPLPAGTGPTVNTPEDTPEVFLAYQPFRTASKNAALVQNVPLGYSVAFSNLNASTQTTSRLGTDLLSTYDVQECANSCDKKAGCIAFNIYFERDPTLKSGPLCKNPPSSTNILCVRYGVTLSAATATNEDSYRFQFHVVHSGSNGYNKNPKPATQPGFSGPVALPAAINAPLDPVTGQNTYLTQKFFSFAKVQTYELGVKACASACTDQTAYNIRYPPKDGRSPSRCNFVVTFLLSDEDSQPQGVYCALYTEEWSSAYATNFGQYRDGKFWANTQVYAFTANAYDELYEPICAKDTCPAGSYQGGNCGGYGPGTCGTTVVSPQVPRLA